MGDGSTARRRQVFARPVDDLWSSSASRDGCSAAPPPREAPLRRGCALQMLGVWLGAAARAASISVRFVETRASIYEPSEGAGAPIAYRPRYTDALLVCHRPLASVLWLHHDSADWALEIAWLQRFADFETAASS